MANIFMLVFCSRHLIVPMDCLSKSMNMFAIKVSEQQNFLIYIFKSFSSNCQNKVFESPKTQRKIEMTDQWNKYLAFC